MMDNEQKTWEAIVNGLSIDACERDDPKFWEAEFAAAPSEQLSDETIKQSVELAVSGELGNWEFAETSEGLDVENAIFHARETDSLSDDERSSLIDKLKNLKKDKGHHDRPGETRDSDSVDGEV